MSNYPEYEIRYDPYTGRQYYVPKTVPGGPTVGNAAQTPGKSGIVRVKGKPGAEAYQMGPNENALLLDETAPIVWLKSTDGAGYPSLDGYSLTPIEDKAETPEENAHYSELEKRIEKLEKLAEVIMNGTESDSGKDRAVGGGSKSRRNGTGAANGVGAAIGDEG